MAIYKKIYVNGKSMQKHRFIMEQHLGRKLRTSEVVHHSDWDGNNNNINNLELMDKTEHNRLSGRRNLTKAKLNKSDVIIIRTMLKDGIKQWLIALAYGVSKEAIRDINTKATWGWI